KQAFSIFDASAMEARRGETARLARCAAQRSGPEGDAQRGKVNDRHKKTRLVRSGFNVLPQTEAGTTKQLTTKYYVMGSVNANDAE
ncbi:hypothetical protein, partial [Franconibacter helveticus]